MVLVVNKAPQSIDPMKLKARVEQIFNCEVAAVLPHSDEMMTLASEGIFVVRYPNHPMTALLKKVATSLTA
jgi:septum site-determining protein MinD